MCDEDSAQGKSEGPPGSPGDEREGNDSEALSTSMGAGDHKAGRTPVLAVSLLASERVAFFLFRRCNGRTGGDRFRPSPCHLDSALKAGAFAFTWPGRFSGLAGDQESG